MRIATKQVPPPSSFFPGEQRLKETGIATENSPPRTAPEVDPSLEEVARIATPMKPPPSVRSDPELPGSEPLRGGTCFQELEAQSLPVLYDLVWQGNTFGETGISSRSAASPWTSQGTFSVPFDPKNTAVLRNGQVVSFGGLPSGDDGFFTVSERTGTKPPCFFFHKLGFTKACAPTSRTFHVLVTNQNGNKVLRINLQNLINDQPNPEPTSGQFWRKTTSPKPRGVVQGRFFSDMGTMRSKVWVVSKGSNNESDGIPSEIESFDFEKQDDEVIDRISEVRSLPFGLRGVCIDSSNAAHDEIWVTAFGQQLGATSETGDGYQVVRIIDMDPFGPTDPTVDVIPLDSSGDPQGPFGITCDVFGKKYVACGISNRIYRISEAGAVEGHAQLPADGNGANGSRGPLGVSIDGFGNLWVQYKDIAKISRIDLSVWNPSDPSSLPAALTDLETPTLGKPENLGDFTGYWTAAGLYPCDVSNGQGSLTNRAKLESGINPFVPATTFLITPTPTGIPTVFTAPGTTPLPPGQSGEQAGISAQCLGVLRR